MKRTILILSIFSIVLIQFGNELYAQGECENALVDANALYESGNIWEGIETLEECIHTMKNEESLFEAYRLMGIMFHDAKDYDSRDNYIELMLGLRPNYSRYPNNDPTEFDRAVKTFRVLPKFYLGLGVATNYNMFSIKESYSVLPYEQQYNYQSGFGIGIHGGLMLKGDKTVSAHLDYSRVGLEHEMIKGEEWNQVYSEDIRMIGLRFEGNQAFALAKNLYCTGGIGLGANAIVRSLGFMKSTYVGQNSVQQQTKDVRDEMNTFQPYLSLKAGLNYQLFKGNIELGLRADQYLRTTINEDRRWNNDVFVYGAQYVNDAIKMRVLNLMISYSFPISYNIYR